MKAVLLHGLGQTARDWRAVMDRIPALEMECPELSSLAEDGAVYSDLLAGLERRCAELPAPFCLCGLSLGAMLALDYAVRHGERVASLILIGAQVRVPTRLVDFQNLVFRCMPKRAFASMGLSKDGAIRLTRSMRCSTSARSWAGSRARRPSSAGRGTERTAGRRRNCRGSCRTRSCASSRARGTRSTGMRLRRSRRCSTKRWLERTARQPA